MCGILGLLSTESISDRAVLAIGRDALSHRGPDDAGEWWSSDGRVGLAHRRLSIIDLSPSGHQPMQSEDGALTIVFNGEIYNFQDLRHLLASKGHCFRTSSDTEVILAAYREWGMDCLGRFNGAFAFALFDRSQQKLFMARDRAGEKPLFYSVANGKFHFASELKGLMADPRFPRQVDPAALDCYLAMGYVPGDRCILRGVNKLPAAHALTFQLNTGELKVWRYWSVPDCDYRDSAVVDAEALLDELESLLGDSVRRQLVADVPVGILLSGGVDSSLITAMAARAAPRVKTFTVRFPGHGNYDETAHARLIARHFGTEHVEVEAGDASVDMLPQLARTFDEPIIDSSMIPTFIVSKLIRQHCSVALGGDGGDELFGGYAHYNRLLWMKQCLGRVPRALRKPIARAADRLLPVGFKGRNWLQGLGTDFLQDLPLIASYFDLTARNHLMSGIPHGQFVAEEIRQRRVSLSSDLLQRATRMDFENYLAEDILVKVDRASMANSLEIRAPLLDHRIIEFAYGKVPSVLKATATSRKVLLKNLCGRVLPREFDQERKQGFSIPLAGWLKGDNWSGYFQDVLLGTAGSPFNKKFIGSLMDGQAKGRANSERLFGLVLFELWRKEYRVSVG